MNSGELTEIGKRMLYERDRRTQAGPWGAGMRPCPPPVAAEARAAGSPGVPVKNTQF
jgi:hypothetical protein